jgi:hypothetical protein
VPPALISLAVSSPHSKDLGGPNARDRLHKTTGCELGHHREDVSSDAMLRKCGLRDRSLALVAQIVRAADSHPSSPHSAGEGLRWIVHSLSPVGLRDHEILEREFIVNHALHAKRGKRVLA